MNQELRQHYERYPYPRYPYLASVRRCDTYALNLETLWARFNGRLPGSGPRRVLLAGCGTFSAYPASLANPDAEITALDLSTAALRRGRIHALLHGRCNISWQQGDILDPAAAPGPFQFIDSFGVIHHLEDPLAGLMALERRLSPGGILRLMVYSRQARQGAESIRRAFRMLGIRDVASAKRLMARSREGSRFHDYLAGSVEAGFDEGIADAFLHPRATTFSIDGLMEMIAGTGLQPLLFAHGGALPEVKAEVERLRRCEAEGEGEGNFILYLGRGVAGGVGPEDDAMLLLNPALARETGGFSIRPRRVSPKLGMENPVLDARGRKFLRRFLKPRPVAGLSPEERSYLRPFLDAMFLVAFREDANGTEARALPCRCAGGS